MAMAETVNIPSLPHGAMWRRSSETTAGRRKSPLKSVGVEAKAVNSAGFIAAIRERLEKRLA